MFDRSCGGSSCHIDFSGQPGGGLDLTPGVSCSELVQVRALEVPEQVLLVPGNPDASYLVCKSKSDCTDLPAVTLLMPPPGGLGVTDLDLLSRWVAAGARGCIAGAD